jgi:ADP-L-glycero-D-manno-heptose 6-epimerase
MTIVLTGGMGFIGSNIAHALHQRGVDLVVVDHLTQGDKFINAAGIPLLDYCDKNDFLEKFSRGHWGQVEAVLHQGACSATVERNGRYMLENNYHYSWQLLQACQTQRIPFIYASSAATYGLAEVCTESDDTDSAHQPLNVYGYSKWLFDQAVRRYWAGHPSATPIVGLRYFNVYGAREQHKGRMASVAYHLYQQMRRGEAMKLYLPCALAAIPHPFWMYWQD